MSDNHSHAFKNPDGEMEPKIGSVWKHYNGQLYVVIGGVNGYGREGHPRNIEYIALEKSNGNRYVRAVSDWRRSMSPVAIKEVSAVE